MKFLIVGQGLAGTAVALELWRRGLDFRITDVVRDNSCSKVAAGLINPITGRRFAKTWLAETLWPAAEAFYRENERLLGSRFYHPLPVYRYLGSIDDQNTWMGRSADESIQEYIGEVDATNTRGIRNDFGAIHIKQGGYLDTRTYLSAARAFFSAQQCILDQSVEVSMSGEVTGVPIEDDTHVIFCEGYRAIYNPLFDYLPFTLAKGEILTIRTDGVASEVIHNKNGFMMPVAANTFKVGSTFRWNDLEEKVTDRSLQELVRKLEQFTTAPYEITAQEAAVRPTVKDRRPLIGTHPLHTHRHIFNGFGSKGVTLTPFFAAHFCDYLQGKTELMSEVDVRRYTC